LPGVRAWIAAALCASQRRTFGVRRAGIYIAINFVVDKGLRLAYLIVIAIRIIVIYIS